MNSKKIVDFIYNFTNLGNKIWLEGKEIKIKMDGSNELTNEITCFIKKNKNQFIEILSHNEVFSPSYRHLMLNTKFNEETIPLSFAQERMFFIEKYEKGTNAYIIPVFIKLKKNISIKILIDSLNQIVNRHEILRTTICQDKNNYYFQKIHDLKDKPLHIHCSEVLNLDDLESKLRINANKIFNLENDYPIRLSIFRLKKSSGENLSFLSIVVHHIAFDGWSTDLLLSELDKLYKIKLKELNGSSQTNQLPEITLQYKDFAYWQKSYVNNDVFMKNNLDFWKTKLTDFEELNLPLDKRRPPKIDYQGHEIYFEIDSTISHTLRVLAKRSKVSLFSIMLSAYYVMLKCYSNQNDLILGIPVAGRSFRQVEYLIGLFINVLPLRVLLDTKQKINNLILEISKEIENIKLHQDVPFEKLVNQFQPIVDNRKHPIFQVMFSVQSFAIEWQRNNKLKDDKIGEIYYVKGNLYEVARVDLTTFIDDSGEALKGSFNYSTAILNYETVRGFIDTYKHILEYVANNPERSVGSTSFLSDSEYNKSIAPLNNTNVNFKDYDIYNLLAKHFYNTTDKVAIRFEEKKLSYQELRDKVNNLVSRLLGKNQNLHQKVVGVYLQRSENSVIALLALLKLGAIYLPIDSKLPKLRVEYILENSKAEAIITEPTLNELLSSEYNNKAIYIDSTNTEFAGRCNVYKVKSDDIAYLIYTSGSTGLPKGVRVSHGNLSNFLNDMKQRFVLTKEDVFLAVTTVSFDISLLEILLPLLSGAVLVLASEACSSNPEELEKLIIQEKCTIMQATPATWGMLFDMGWENKTGVKILCGGDAINSKLYQQFYSGSFSVWNLYGPTETTIWSTICNLKDMDENNIIGLPISNTYVYILDQNLRLLPSNAIGEICIGGKGVSAGYHNQLNLTDEKYVNYDLPNGTKIQLYKTGDLGRLHNGKLVYLGRKDSQVKVRGFRIEIDEVEQNLIQSGLVKEVFVHSAKDHDGYNRLVAHIVPSDNLAKSKLNFSLFYFSSQRKLQDAYYLYLESAKFADAKGFEAIWTPERHFHGVGANYPNPSVLTAALTTITKNIKLRAGSVVSPLHNPIRVAEEWAVIDVLSNGRAGVSFASGWNVMDFVLNPENYQRRKQIMFENIKTVRSLWKGDFISAKNGLKNETHVKIFPKPIQKNIPIWVTTSFAEETFIEAGRVGANILTHLLGQDVEELRRKIELYKKSLESNNFNPEDFTVTLMLHTFVADKTENALKIAKEPFCNYLRSHISLINKSDFVKDIENEDSNFQTEQIIDLAFKKYSNDSSLIGSVNKCMKFVQELNAIGVSEIAAFIDFGIKDEIVLGHLEYLSELKERTKTIINIDSNILTERLALFLPNYMIPNTFLYHNSFQYSNSGKLDRKLLVEKAKEHFSFNVTNNLISESKINIAPSNEFEQKICNLWAKILNFEVHQVSMNSNFFKLGGHSILAIKLVNSINKEIGTRIDVADIFTYNTPELLLTYISSCKNDIFKSPEIETNKVLPDIYPLSYGQERIWFINQYTGGTDAYNVPIAYILDKSIDIEILRKALNYIFSRHEILRTIIKVDDGGNLSQYVYQDDVVLNINYIQVNNEDELNNKLKQAVQQPFDLRNEFPFKCSIYDVSERFKCLFILIHHIAFDGWSLEILENELWEFYNFHLSADDKGATSPSLPQLKWQYKDFSHWQRTSLNSTFLANQLNFWKSKLEGFTEVELNSDLKRPDLLTYSGDEIFFQLDENISSDIKEFGRKFNISVFSITLAAFYLTIKNHTSNNDIIIGIPIANRQYPDVENLIGFFLNSLPIRMTIDEKHSLLDFVRMVHSEIIEAQKNQDLPFEQIVKELKMTKILNKHPIFQIMFENKNMHLNNKLYEKFLPYSMRLIHKVARFDLNIFVDETQEIIKGSFNYATQVLTKECVQQLLMSFIATLKTISLAYGKNLLESSLLEIFTNNKNAQKSLSSSDPNILVFVQDKLKLFCSELLFVRSNTIAMNDDFFAIGGDSIMAMKLMAKINKEFAIKLTLKRIFTANSLDELSQIILHKINKTRDYHEHER